MLPFIDLAGQQQRLKAEIDAGIARVLAHGHYIMGPEVTELEHKLGQFCGAKHVITCSNGTDALMLMLMAKNVGAGDAVIVPSFTFCATAEAVALLGATPIFVDVLPDTFNIDPTSLDKALLVAKEQQLKPVGVLAVDLFGLPADYSALQTLCDAAGLWLLADAAQSFSGAIGHKKVGSLTEMTATSFFPAKPLGCYGDGGAVFTNDDDLAEVLRSLRVHGKGQHKYDNIRIGMNARLDTLQAAILLPKLAVLSEERERKQALADAYNAAFADFVQVPVMHADYVSAWAQYTLVLPESVNRDDVQAQLKAQGVPTAVYYPLPLHRQTAYQHFPVAGELSVSETMAARVLSLPMHAYMNEASQKLIIGAMQHTLNNSMRQIGSQRIA